MKFLVKNLKKIGSENVVFSCGSGVTACVLALAYSLINDKYLPKIYDGSWAEYGKNLNEKIYKNNHNITFFLIIAIVIIGRTMIGNHFKKKFSKRPPPGIIVTEVIEKAICRKIRNIWNCNFK